MPTFPLSRLPAPCPGATRGAGHRGCRRGRIPLPLGGTGGPAAALGERSGVLGGLKLGAEGLQLPHTHPCEKGRQHLLSLAPCCVALSVPGPSRMSTLGAISIPFPPPPGFLPWGKRTARGQGQRGGDHTLDADARSLAAARRGGPAAGRSPLSPPWPRGSRPEVYLAWQPPRVESFPGHSCRVRLPSPPPAAANGSAVSRKEILATLAALCAREPGLSLPWPPPPISQVGKVRQRGGQHEEAGAGGWHRVPGAGDREMACV